MSRPHGSTRNSRRAPGANGCRAGRGGTTRRLSLQIWLGALALGLVQPALAQQPVQQPDVFTPPELASTVAPSYPSDLAETDDEVTVTLEVIVGTDGRVAEALVSESGGEAFDRAAINAVQQWQFRPARWGSEPVVSRLTIPVRFLPPAGEATTPEGDADLEAELAAELAQIQAQPPAQTAPLPPPPAPGGRGPSPRGLSTLMNPAISATALLLGGWSSRAEEGDHEHEHEHEHGRHDLETGPHLQEVELRLSAVVDPFFRADLTLAAHADEIGFEEAYLSTLEIPWVTVRAGQMYANFGRHNVLHTHSFPFLTAPLPWRALLGPEGLNDTGVSADVLIPLPFFTEINAQVFSGEWRPFAGSVPDDPGTAEDESVPDQRNREDFAYVGHLKTLFELGESSTMELGGSYAGGRNGFGGWSHVVGGDLTVKWRPVEAERYRGFEWATEILWEDRQDTPEDEQSGGAYTHLRYQFQQRWWLQGRGALLGLPEGREGRTWRAEALLAFIPSEFSALRLQYAYETMEEGHADPVNEVFLQAVVSVGSHPAHAY